MPDQKKGVSRRNFVKAGTLATATVAASQVLQAGSAESAAMKEEPLKDYAVTHAGIRPLLHPRLGVEVNSQTAVRYLRFLAPAKIDRLELGRIRYGRAIPQVPTHPAHLVISTLNEKTSTWEIIREVDLPPDPDVAGEGLNQEMTEEEMDAHFKSILDKPPYVIELGGFEATHLRVECDREHPYWPNHGECNGGEFNVPFGALNNLCAYGDLDEDKKVKASYIPGLKIVEFDPNALDGMTVTDKPDMLLFEGKFLSIGFSMRRPVLMHFGWDVLGETAASKSRLLASCNHGGRMKMLGGLSGPLLRTLDMDYGSHRWTGEVAVKANRVEYKNLRAVNGLTINAAFTVEPKRILIELEQSCEKEISVLEAEAWRIVWDLSAGITGAAAKPTLLPGRNGDVEMPFLWATDGVGCLSFRKIEGADKDVQYQVESYRSQSCLSGGVVFGNHPRPSECFVIPKGTRKAVFELALTNIEPLQADNTAEPSNGLRRHWPTVFSCFRPEYRGFSNNAASVNCHLSQGPPLEIAAYTARNENGLEPLELARYTIGRSFLDGGGYGYWRNLYLDSDPIVVSAAGRIHQAKPEMAWLRLIEPGFVETVQRMGEKMQGGLAVCTALSGNSGSYRWSTNAMDVVGFGHIDAYVNAWTYRAFRNATALLTDLGRKDLAERCRAWAAQLRETFTKELVNPETGWVVGWRSRDGELHDYAFTWVNGAALAFGLLDPPAAKKALENLEHLRETQCPPTARMGIPCNLLPIAEEDQTLPRILGLIEPTFEKYTDGSLSGWPATYYLRALSIYGLKDRAKKMAKELDEGYEAGIFNGGMGAGNEFCSWEGFATGYEGTLIGCFGPMYAIAIEQGVLKPREPEWWPAGG